MLKNIPPILSPELLKVLCEMGHGDEIILADGNFPAESIGKDAIVIRADGHGTVEAVFSKSNHSDQTAIPCIFCHVHRLE